MESPRTVAVGDIQITSVWDGTLEAKLESILKLDPVEARRLVEANRQASGVDPLTLHVRAFLIRAGGKLALVDSGSGTSKGPSMGHLPASLARAGVAASDIDCVMLTHMHMDHVGGLIDDAGRPCFPKAELVLHQAEARYFLDTPESELDDRSRRNLPFQRQAIAAYGDRVRRVADGDGIPGIAARLAPGHTPGHTCWEVSSRGASALVIGDVVHLGAVQLPRPSTAMIYDVDGDLAGRTRADVLDRVAASGMLVAGAHLPAPGLGRILRAGAGYRFEAASDQRQA